jgi:sigma-B regulation protein RsbU (phosphoserine phosphatase)
MGLRARLLLAFGLVALLGVGAATVAAERYLASRAREDLGAELHRAADVYEALEIERTGRRIAEARVIAEEPRLKAVVRTLEIDRATLEDVADEIRRAAQADLFAFTDRMGQVTADASLDEGLEADLSVRPELKRAFTDGEASAVWSVGDALHQVVVRPILFGSEVSAMLVTGHRLQDQSVRAARLRTGCEVAILLGTRVVAAAFGTPAAAPDGTALAALPEGLSPMTLGGERFVVLKRGYPGAETQASLVLGRSLDAALGRHRNVRLALFGIGGLSLLGALGLGLVLARGITRPVERLSRATRQVAAGDVSVRVPVEGTDELAQLSSAFNTMIDELGRSRAALVEKERLEREMQIAQRIQTALLPRVEQLGGYRMAACMEPASSVGGDFYELRQTKDGRLLFAIGDVTSHGLTPGLIMMMTQSTLAALADHDEGLLPSELLTRLNRTLYRNVRERLGEDDHLTFTLFKEVGPGRFLHAGSHLPILVRRRDGRVEALDTDGPWTGLLPDIAGMVKDTELTLEVGDRLVLYTDGITESRNAAGEQFDQPGLTRVIAESDGDVLQLRDRILEAVKRHSSVQDDDRTLLVLERLE